MKSNTFEYPKSSFLGLPKDTALIMNKILSNEKVLKLLYYTDTDWKCGKPLTAEQKKELFYNKQISNVPKVKVDEERTKRSYLRVTFDSFTPNSQNDYFRDHIIEVKIICHFDTWELGDFEMRPYRIAGEIDAMLNKSKLTGIGELQFVNADQDVYDEEYGGVTLRYLAIRGHEDEVNPLE